MLQREWPACSDREENLLAPNERPGRETVIREQMHINGDSRPVISITCPWKKTLLMENARTHVSILSGLFMPGSDCIVASLHEMGWQARAGCTPFAICRSLKFERAFPYLCLPQARRVHGTPSYKAMAQSAKVCTKRSPKV